MTDLGSEVPEFTAAWPSIDDVQPGEEGGPNARRGFNYQDEIAVSFLIDMLEDPRIIKIHCETHDDVVLVRADLELQNTCAEYIQVIVGLALELRREYSAETRTPRYLDAGNA